MVASVSLSSGGYAPGGGGTVGISATPDDDSTDYWSLAKCKKAYLDYLGSKRLEIDEQQEARRYRHGAHWTAAQVEVLNQRKQPVVTYNRIGRKIDGIVGLVEKLRQDPKAFPRTPQHEDGADLATAVIRYAMDQQEWQAKSPLCAESGAVDGVGGIELELVEGDRGDKEVGFEVVDTDGFFYDPRSFRHDFSDATYMGIGKWLDPEVAKELIPGKETEIDDSVTSGGELTSNSAKDDKWFSTEGERKRIRLVDIWYRHKGNWCWALFTGSTKLMEGKSYFLDEKGKTICKFIMYSACVDHDGDRYGFVRNLKSANDEINQRRSKGLHELNTRRIIAQDGHFTDVEKARREAARPDGMVIYNPVNGEPPKFDDAKKQADIAGQVQFLEDAKAEIENFGPNPALIGTGVNAKSGRAIALMQQAGIAELGPYILAYRGWKLRVYRAVFNAIRSHWTAERWIRVTDEEGLAQFVRINAMQVDPMTGMPTLVNAIGQLDVDILLDEGPDTVTMMEDMYETLSNVIPSIAPLLHPMEAKAVVKMLIDTSPLASVQKKAFRQATEQAAQQPPQPDPAVQAAQAKAQIDLEAKQAQFGLDAQKAQNEIEIANVRAATDIQNKRAQTQADIEAMQLKTAADLQAQQLKTAADLQADAQRNDMQCDMEQRKASIQLDAHRQKTDMTASATGTTQKVLTAIEGVSETVQKLDKKVDGLASEVSELADDLNAPTEIIRGPDGRATGAKRGKRTMSINRGPRGEMTGIS